MSRWTPPSHAFASRAFTVGEALAAGASRKALRGSRFVAPHRGVRSLAPPESGGSTAENSAFLDATMLRLALDYLPLMRVDRGECFSHTTALVLHGAPIRAEPLLHTTIQLPHGAARGRNVRGHNVREQWDPWPIAVDEALLPCAPPEVALLQAASFLSFTELVVATDRLILPRGSSDSAAPLAALEDLIELARRAPVRGVAKLRAALQVARVGAESRMESLQHLELARMGLDTLELQAELYDREGRWIGRFDAVDREKLRIMEYDGEQHRTDRRQYLRDLEKLERARNAGYGILRLHKEDFTPWALPRTRARMCSFLEERPRAVPRELERYLADPPDRR